MLDHAFLAAVECIRQSFDAAMLDRQAAEERFHSDLILGDLTWEVSYVLPGEGRPPRVRADVTIDWPTWSQTAYRTWRLEGELEEPPELGIEVVLRVQRLAAPPDLAAIRSVLEEDGPELSRDRLRRTTPLVEQSLDDDLTPTEWAVEYAYDGTFEMTEAMLADVSLLGPSVAAIGPWVASVLVRLGDLRLAYVPPDESGEER